MPFIESCHLNESVSFLQLEIKNHIFFSLINWDDLINKKITPPFNPNVVSICVFLSKICEMLEVNSIVSVDSLPPEGGGRLFCSNPRKDH